MATLEAATVELQNLNGTSDIQLEAMFEHTDKISALNVNVDRTNVILVDILNVMQDFISAVPKEISKGYDALLGFQEKQALLAGREEDANSGDDEGKKGKKKTSGFFESNFKKGMEKDLGFVSFLKDNIAEVIVVAGTVAAAFSGSFGLIIKAMKGLVSIAGFIGKLLLPLVKGLGVALRTAIGAISLPFAAITAILIGLVAGIMQAVEDFQGEDGTFVDKLIAGFGGFIKGFMKLITVPLDLLKDAISWVAGALGFDDFATMLDGFSVTDGFSDLVDIAVDFLQGIKDWIGDRLKEAANKITGIFNIASWFKEESPENTPSASDAKSVNPTTADSPAAEVAALTTADSPAAEKVASVSGANNSASGSGEGSPEKVKIPEGVRVTTVGKYASYNKETNSQAVFSSVKDAVTFMNAPIEEAAKMDPFAAELYEESKKATAKREASNKKMLARLKSKDKSESTSDTSVPTSDTSVLHVAPIINAVSGPQSQVAIGEPVSVNIERPPGTIVGRGDRVQVSNSMAVENNKLEEKKAEMNQSGPSNAIVSANNNSTNISSSTHNHGMPSATDKSDRTDRRGSFRGA